MGQLWRLVRESHEQPILGESRAAELVSPGELGVTFIGHSSFLLQIGGRNVLVDPVFAKRLILLRRQRRPGVLIEEMPPIDLVLVTHAHMDHLNLPSLRRIVRATRRLRGRGPEIVVPHGVNDLVSQLGFRRVSTLKWWQGVEAAGLQITMTPCRHWGARMFRDTHRGYGGYVIDSGGQTVYHSGDTAYFDGFAEIGRRLSPEVALLPIGAYFPDSYRAVHTSPEEAVRGFMEVGAQWMVPMHYGTFRLGREPMDEPVKRLRAEADRLGIGSKIKVLSEGETFRI
ncbi:MBL fold metallo-hydrolase [Edaphobacter modestus]|uniref:L-ascorbate metabolism protein UlaG (Beta-lactamase superfamily) n=1 Tax=Edaphobacter modestus TaxID=388466 RepID=A0A4V2G4R1_9BACT|nr:MBL fold metallo-hydrolase [Edaphobacter modestus]RZU41966.1 L-ascorbate metabolism protein UlaG (beta-lactamase superfamily) [Edaphobacter modestus]